jgi:ArsR family transcriptional regulator
MDEPQIVSALSALAHQHRLRIFRLLVVAGPSGIPAGEIADAVGVSPAALSFHLKELDHAGLVTATRDGRYVRYAVHVEGMRRLLEYLTEDCCRGQPELCGSPVKKVRNVCKSKAGTK